MKKIVNTSSGIVLSVLLLASNIVTAQEPDCSRYAERLDELDLFMRQNPTPQQQRYYQGRQQELVGGQAVCQRGTTFSVPESVSPQSQQTTNVQPIYPAQTQEQQPIVITQEQQSLNTQTQAQVAPQVQPKPQIQPQTQYQQGLKEGLQQGIQQGHLQAQQQAQAAQGIQQQPQTELAAPRLPPGMSKEQYYQSLCKLARDTYEDDPSEKNRNKMARFCN